MEVMLIPPAGGSARLRRDWAVGLGERARVSMPAVTRPPGSGLREIAARLVGLTPESGPWILAGHSIGGLIALETVHALGRTGGHLPERVILMATPPPSEKINELFRPLLGEDIDNARFIRELIALGVLEPGFEEHPLRALVTGGLRRDLRMLLDYPTAPPAPIPCPLEVWNGLEDPIAPPQHLAYWTGVSTAGVRGRIFPGGHDFPTSQLGEVLAALELSPAPAPPGPAER